MGDEGFGTKHVRKVAGHNKLIEVNSDFKSRLVGGIGRSQKREAQTIAVENYLYDKCLLIQCGSTYKRHNIRIIAFYRDAI